MKLRLTTSSSATWSAVTASGIQLALMRYIFNFITLHGDKMFRANQFFNCKCTVCSLP